MCPKLQLKKITITNIWHSIPILTFDTLSKWCEPDINVLGSIYHFSSFFQAWSFVTSIGSIAWSFSSNYARRKFGQMSMLSRFIYFLYILMAVVSRITLIEFFVISLDNFHYIYAILAFHIIVVLILDISLNWKTLSDEHWFWKGKAFLIRGFASIFLHFPVTEEDDQKEEDLR